MNNNSKDDWFPKSGVGILLIKNEAMVTAPSEKVFGKEAFLSKANEVSIIFLCFLLAVPFCS